MNGYSLPLSCNVYSQHKEVLLNIKKRNVKKKRWIGKFSFFSQLNNIALDRFKNIPASRIFYPIYMYYSYTYCGYTYILTFMPYTTYSAKGIFLINANTHTICHIKIFSKRSCTRYFYTLPAEILFSVNILFKHFLYASLQST